MFRIEKQGKRKGLGTMPSRKAGLHTGGRGTRPELRSAECGTGHGTDRGTIPCSTTMARAEVAQTLPEMPR